MKSKMRKKLIAFMLCMVLVICNSVSILADAPAAATTATEKQVKETGTAKSEGESEEEKSADDEKDTSEQSDEESAPETETTEKKEETTEATTEDKEDATTEATTKAKEETTEATETSDKDQTTGAEDDSDKKDKTSESSEEETDKEKTTEAKDETAPSELTYTNDDVVITVSEVAEGAIPEGAELKVVPILKDDADTQTQYAEVEEKIQEKAAETETEIKGFLAYDITFVDEDGNEIEPNSEVKVSIEYKQAAIPAELSEEDAKKTEVSVMHLEEDADGNVSQVVDMGEAGKVDTLETTDAKQVEKVEVKTESFSAFVITWGGWPYGECTVHVHYRYIDDNGNLRTFNENAGTEIPNLKNNQEIDLMEFQKEAIEGYEDYTCVRIVTDNPSSDNEISKLQVKSSTSWVGTTYSIDYLKKEANTYTPWLSTSENREGNIYFIYEKVDLKIKDSIIENGTLDAEYTGEATPVEYKWYKSGSKDGEYKLVEKVNYQGGASNLSEDGKALYPAYDEGAREWYKVEVIFEDGKTTESKPYQVPYYDELENGGFETPQTNSFSAQFSNSEYLMENGVWQSTAVAKNGSNKSVSIEIVREGVPNGDNENNGYSWYQDWDNAAIEGKQFAELNCEAAGALYQDVLTMQGTSLNYWLEHRARGSEKSPKPEFDTMYLVIMPSKEAIDNHLTTQDKLTNYLYENCNRLDINQRYEQVGNSIVYDNKEKGILVVRVTSSDQAWQHVEGLNKYVPTSSVTRFFFVAGNTEVGDSTVGNVLDDVHFTQKLPAVADDEFTLQISKKFEGSLDDTALSKVQDQIQFEISVKDIVNNKNLSASEIKDLLGIDNIINGSDIDSGIDGSLTITIPNRKIVNGHSYEITIKEVNAELSGYGMSSEVQTSIKNGESDTVTNEPVKGDQATVSITGKTMAYVTFTNTYDRAEKKNINFQKVWDDDNNAYNTRPENLKVTLKATITVGGKEIELTKEDLGLDSLEKTLTAEAGWKTVWENVPVYYNYTDAKGKVVKKVINYTVEEGQIDSNYLYTSGDVQYGDSKDYKYQIDMSNPDETLTSSDNNKINKTSAALSASAASVKVQAASNGTEAGTLGKPGHHKYVEYNKQTGDYTLNLDVTGAKGEATGVDVLFVIDTSGSMGSGWGNNNLLPNVQNLLTKNNGIIDQIFKTTDNVNSVAYVSFAGKDETYTSRWYDTDSKQELKRKINNLHATGGTNWTYAMQQASKALDDRAGNKNDKVVIFLSDGAPTYSMGYDWWWGQQYYDEIGNGSDTENSYYSDAANVVTGSDSLKDAEIYSVYLTDGTKSGMEKFSEKLSNSELINGINLSSALTTILKTIIPTYKDVVITDTLSDYVEFVNLDEITVTKKVGNSEEPLYPGQYNVTISGKTIKVELLNGNSLEDQATYTVSFRIKPNETADQYYAQHKGYPHTGDSGTGTTSEGKKGFYSNEENTAKVSYKVNDTPDSADYPRPVVQVTTHTLTYTKKWSHPTDVADPNEDITLNVTYNTGETGTVILKNDENYTYTETVPVTKTIREISEETEIKDYVPYCQVAQDGLSATVTNTYSKLTTQNITVQKDWVGDKEEQRPESITVALYRSTNDQDTQLIEKRELNENNAWKTQWTNLRDESVVGGNVEKYSYAVREIDTPLGYSSSISYEPTQDGIIATITNTYDENCEDENLYIANVLQTEKVNVQKIWDDNQNTLGYRPNNLDVTVHHNNDDYSVSLTENGGWSSTLTLPKQKNSATTDYSATESLPDNHYKLESTNVRETLDGYVIELTNTLDYETIFKSIIVKKDWNDREGTNRPVSIQFAIQYREKDSNDEWQYWGNRKYTLTEEDTIKDAKGDYISWAKEIKNLPIENEYKIVEVNVADNYNSVVTPDGNTFTITNTLKWSLKKTNLPESTEQAIPLTGATFDLKNENNELIAQGTSGEDGFVVWELTEVGEKQESDLQNLNGDYTLIETKAPAGYQKLDTASWKLTFKEGLLTNAVGAEGDFDVYISATEDAQRGIVVTLKNDLLYELPETGGPGVHWYTLGGSLLMAGAALIVYRQKRKREVLLRK